MSVAQGLNSLAMKNHYQTRVLYSKRRSNYLSSRLVSWHRSHIDQQNHRLAWKMWRGQDEGVGEIGKMIWQHQ
ncbi:unnamed protein product [Nesidiocoris tenuis]|uniref:Uncharacterized protein n=1 Tax=Nesidiocoris tenuis TaxID=355587 RepID=A0A6H5HIS2_9HEMI|nr:unnamed protein product [Nesidiocoris tenuis]